MIKIIQGTYGHREGATIVPKTEADGPFEATPEQEERLVRLGVAVYVETPAAAPNKVPDDKGAGSKDVDELPEYNIDMKLDELKEIAKAYGVDASDARKKADVIAMIEAAKAEDPDGETPEGDDGEAPPSLDAADPVE
ncbi:hypothetical protein [Tepidibacillus marianensis]|uniref:hypothetical protein n=1 Tax=Tepidibacillus marianensis TaxID=3131995 RepID=UPI0030CD55F1